MISIVVMLILAGVSLNATVGDNGIISKAKNATYAQSRAVLEEYLNQYYVENYEDLSEAENKAVALKNDSKSRDWFYQGAPLGYVVDSDGNSHYFINVSGLPNEIKSSIRGGNANGKSELTYQDYAKMEDIYGVTNDLKVYYCSNGKDSITGIGKDNLDTADSTKEIFAAGSDMAKLITGSTDQSLTLEDLKSVKQLTINSSSGINNLKDIYALPSLKELTLSGVNWDSLDGIENATNINYVYFNNCTIGNYSSLSKLSKSLEYLYVYNIDDVECEKLCSKTNGIGNADFGRLNYLAIVGNTSYISSTERYYPDVGAKSTKTITTLAPLNNLTDSTKSAVKYLTLHNNNINGDLSSLQGFVNVTCLRISGNKISNLNGISNMKNLAYIFAQNNQLGIGESESAENSTTDSLVPLYNNNTIYYCGFENNPQLKWVKYLNGSNIRHLKLLGNTGMIDSSLASIRSVIKKCGSNASYPTKYWLSVLDSETENLDLSSQTLTKSQLDTVATYTNLKVLNLNNIKLTDSSGSLITTSTSPTFDECLNNALSKLTSLTNVDLNNLSNLSQIYFVKNTPNLREILMFNTKISTVQTDSDGDVTYGVDQSSNVSYSTTGGKKIYSIDKEHYTGLELLNFYTKQIGLIAVNNSTCDLSKIEDALVGCLSNTKACSTAFLENNGVTTSISGFYTTNDAVWSSLSKTTKLKEIYVYNIGASNACTVDLTGNLSLTKYRCGWGNNNYNLILPPKLNYIFVDSFNGSLDFSHLTSQSIAIDICSMTPTNIINNFSTLPNSITISNFSIRLNSLGNSSDFSVFKDLYIAKGNNKIKINQIIGGRNILG